MRLLGARASPRSNVYLPIKFQDSSLEAYAASPGAGRGFAALANELRRLTAPFSCWYTASIDRPKNVPPTSESPWGLPVFD